MNLNTESANLSFINLNFFDRQRNACYPPPLPKISKSESLEPMNMLGYKAKEN